MTGIGISILMMALCIILVSLAKMAGMSDRKLEEIQKIAVRKETGDPDGNKKACALDVPTASQRGYCFPCMKKLLGRTEKKMT